uniref:Uncharacterized protein n=1 Tax=Salix viminalis TaxID=40686 RepID=A0A6N2N0X9_SALVM
MIALQKKACFTQFPQVPWKCTDCLLNLILRRVRKLMVACRRKLIHPCMKLQQILDIMIPHMMRRKEKQVRTICMESLKVASQQNMTKRNGKT